MVKEPGRDRTELLDPARSGIEPAASSEESEPRPAEQGATEAGAARVSAAPDELEALRREREDYRGQLLRTAAEFDNYRKRVERERREQGEHATRTLLLALLPILDDFERALRADVGDDTAGYRRGVDLIYRQLLDLLASRGVTPIEAVGTRFDPRVHEAVLHVESAGRENGEVVEELRRGYMMGERLLRPALVKVAKA